MSALAEFFLIAFVIYLWESGLWLPDRGVALRRTLFGKKWRILRPDSWMKTREVGLVPAIPFLPDTGLAPCQTPPLIVDDSGTIFGETEGSSFVKCDVAGWEDLHEVHPRLICDGLKIRLSSPRAIDDLRTAKKRGDSPAEAIRWYWKRTLSPSRAGREWKKWRLASMPLELPCGLLTAGFFVGLPLIYIRHGILPALAVVLFLWLLMLIIAIGVWWIGRRVYPTVKSQFKMDAFLCLIVPFHAMRALEIASVHAMAKTHPAALILHFKETDNPWLASFVRHLLHPRPNIPNDDARPRAILPILERTLNRLGKTAADYESIPSDDNDPANVSYCPRCLAVFEKGVSTCNDCRGVPLKPLS